IGSGEVRAKMIQVIAIRPQVVVDNVQQYRQPLVMASIDQALESFGSAISVMRRIQCHTIITPAMTARKFRHRHEFHMSNAKLAQMIEASNRRIKGACRSKSPDMDFLDHA